MHWQVVVYPLGLLRIIETVLAVCALASVTNHSGHIQFHINCSDNTTSNTASLHWDYPYDLPQSSLAPDVSCESKSDDRHPIFLISFRNQAQFYVFFSAASLLISILALFIYCLKWDNYETDARYAIMDTVCGGFFTAAWLTSTGYWGSAVSVMKSYLTFVNVEYSIHALETCQCQHRCYGMEYDETFGGLNFSLVCGIVSVSFWLIQTFLSFRQMRRLNADNERFQYGSATVADAFSTAHSVRTLD